VKQIASEEWFTVSIDTGKSALTLLRVVEKEVFALQMAHLFS
jgi:hypothetical protein